jgi:hypothetical protein
MPGWGKDPGIKCSLHKRGTESGSQVGNRGMCPVCLPVLCGTDLDSSSCALGVSLALQLVLVEPQAAPLPQFTHSSGEKDAPCLVVLLGHPGPFQVFLCLCYFSCSLRTGRQDWSISSSSQAPSHTGTCRLSEFCQDKPYCQADISQP